MTSSELRVRTHNQDILKQTQHQRDKASRSSLVLSVASPPKQSGLTSPLPLAYKRECYGNFVKPNNMITNS